MNDKKTQLIHAAIKLFGDRDYHTASVQEIVSLAGVSKGAFYQHFQSKEEILFSIYSHYFDRLLTELKEMELNQTQSPKEIIIRGLELHCQLILENKDFLRMMVKGTAFTEKVISEFMVRRTLALIQWFQQRIEALYGPDIEPHSMDCATMLNGSLKEYFFLYIFSSHPIDSAKLALYLFERLNDLVDGIHRKQPDPLLNSSLNPKNELFFTDRQRFESALENIRLWIQAHVEDERIVTAMLQSLETIVSELDKEHGNELIMQGMYSYILTLARDYSSLTQQLEHTLSPRIRMTS